MHEKRRSFAYLFISMNPFKGYKSTEFGEFLKNNWKICINHSFKLGIGNKEYESIEV